MRHPTQRKFHLPHQLGSEMSVRTKAANGYHPWGIVGTKVTGNLEIGIILKDGDAGEILQGFMISIPGANHIATIAHPKFDQDLAAANEMDRIALIQILTQRPRNWLSVRIGNSILNLKNRVGTLSIRIPEARNPGLMQSR